MGIQINFTPHPGQRKIWEEKKRFNVVTCGRRFGKTTFGSFLAVQKAARGEPVGWFAPNYRLLEEAYTTTKTLLAPLISNASSNPPVLTLRGGGVIEYWTLVDPDAVARGRKYKRAIIDEAAAVRYLERAWTESIRPTLTDLQGDAWFFSTPKGRNYFYQLWRKSQNTPDWAGWQMPTTVNSTIPHLEKEVETARRDIPEAAFAQEYLAQFIEDSAQVFRNVYELSVNKPERPQAGRSYACGVDWGKHNDFTAFSVWDIAERKEVYLERFNQIDYSVQAGRLEALHKSFQFKSILAEANAMGEPIIDSLKKLGLPIRAFWTTNQSKANLVESLSLAMQRREVTLVNDAVANDELLSFEYERLPGGLMRYAAPGDMHDDTVMARLLGYEASKPIVHRRSTAPAYGDA